MVRVSLPRLHVTLLSLNFLFPFCENINCSSKVISTVSNCQFCIGCAIALAGGTQGSTVNGPYFSL